MYTLEPFGRAELRTFAEAWFTVQQTSDPADDATTFLRQVDDGELRELARNPLLATLAAIAYTLEPGRPLPTGRLGLYERFFEHLVVQDAAGRRTMAELRRLHAGQAARLRTVEWLHQQRVSLLRHLAVTRLDSERSLLETAHEWVNDHATDLQPGWQNDLETILHATGLLVFDGDADRFLHHSLAEFLAAQEHAGRTGPDFPDVETWIDRALRPAEREFAMFMFAMWGQRPGHHLGLVFNALLGGHPDRLLLAGRLLARATTTAETDNRRVVDRLADLALGSAVISARGGQYDAVTFTNVSTTAPSSVTEVLGQLSRNVYAGDRLMGIAQMPGAPKFLRIEAMQAYGRIGERDLAVAGLRRLAEVSAGIDQVAAAKAILALAPDDADSTAALRRIAADPDQTLEARAKAAAELNSLGHAADAAACASEILTCHPIDGDTIGSVVSTWLASTADAAAHVELVESLSGRELTALQCTGIAQALSEAGRRVDAARFAARALAAAGDGARLQNAAKVYAGPNDVSADEMRTTLLGAPTPEALAHVARGLAEAGRTEPAVELARAAITHPVVEGHVIGVAAAAWLAAAGESAIPAVRQTIEEALTASQARSHYGPIAFQLAEAGHRQLAVEFARKALASVGDPDWAMWQAVQAWLTAAGTSASAEVEEAIRSIPVLTPMLLARAAEAAALGGAMVLAERMATEAIAGDVVTTYRVGSAARALCLALGPAAGERLHRILTEQSYYGLTAISVAEHLCASGAIADAQRAWSYILSHPEASLENIAIAIAGLIQTGGEAVIADTLATAPPNRVSELAVLTATLRPATPTTETARRL